MQTIKRAAAFGLMGILMFTMMGCGSDGPLGNNAPQGRPDWMKKSETPPQAPAAPQKQ
ncbi:hypothetical protein [Methylomagnum sp.]